MNNPTLNVRIVTPRQILFDGIASSVSSVNSQGKFDILPEHANFITIVENNPIIIHDADKKVFSYNFPLAIIYTAKNIVHIYTNIPSQKSNII